MAPADVSRLAGAPDPGAAPANVSTVVPFHVEVERFAAFLNAELPDHPIYDGFELQWFDDPRHGTGMLVFLSRRSDRRIDYYHDPGLRLTRTNYVIGAGTNSWNPTTFEVARLRVGADGVDAEVVFTDRDGRRIELLVDDRAAGPRRPGVLLAPIGAAIEQPRSLLLVLVHGFDLVRRTDTRSRVRIDGADVTTGRLPLAALHRRELVKYGGPVTVATLCPDDGTDRAPRLAAPGTRRTPDGRAIVGLRDDGDGARAELRFTPPLPVPDALPEDRTVVGHLEVRVDDLRVTGGRWRLRRRGEEVAVHLDVTDRWPLPVGQPPLVAAVTRLVPVFRRWPTTYRWRARLSLGATPRLRGRWERTGGGGGGTYRALTRRR
ncbi:hypothetical protein FTX61_01620 [Nitriliruptoraceae bacterium ZYF776]|nr:hypothetical protein [Profundirhabdus halotolerans]